MKNKLLLSLALSLALVLPLVSCSDGELSGGNVPGGDFTPATDEGLQSELYKRYETYKMELPLAFSASEPLTSDNFEFEETDGGVRITRYIGNDSVAIIPGVIGEKAVISLAAGAFEGRNMRAIYVPDSVAEVERGALAGCNGLVTLRLPRIYGGFLGYAFGADEYAKNAVTVPQSLDRLIIGEGAEKIEANAFSGCKNLSAVLLPETLKEIGEFAFFECGDLVYVHIGVSIQKIGEYAFATCPELYAVDCRNADIELGAFYNCRSLNNITFSDFSERGAYLGYLFGAETVDYSADFVPYALRKVTLTGCSSIPSLAFADCKHLTEVEINEGADSIGVRAFYGCASLVEAELPQSLKSIDDDAFFGCSALVTVSFGESLTSLGKQVFMGCGALKSIALPKALKTLEAGTFYGCASLITVDLGGVTRIEKDAFAKCQRLVPVSVEGISVAEGNDALVCTSGSTGE